jgi:CubicO group peptidase (beta-lactamase class C family)
MSRTALKNLILVFCLASAGVVGAPPDAVVAAKAGLNPERLGRIATRMQSFVDKGTISGAVILVARHGVVAELDAVGFQEVENKKPMRTDSIFQLMSMTKPVTAAGIMILAEEGRLALGDPVEKYLPEFRSMWLVDTRDGEKTRTLKRPSRLITIRDLLTHTSGLPQMPPPGIKNLLSTLDRTLAEAVNFYSQMPLDFEPGTKWQYSNPGIATLGRIIEVVSDQPYERFLEERIFKPLGMKDSFFFPAPDKIDRIAMLYRSENGKLVKAGPESLAGDPWKYRKGAKYPCPECGLYSTAPDLASFYQMVLNGGTYKGKRILSKPGVEVMTALHTGDITPAGHVPGQGYGLAWAVVRDPIATLPFLSLGSYGHGGAFGTYGWVDPKLDMVRVLMIQTSGGSGMDERNTFLEMAGAAVE